mmetsp:Transcript_45023/g.72323  ORF Transcript_45023/g.72323 Transcript_45023/m.72323 type:complete len:246 (+) Transcript_45023:294-1031(+)
MKRVKKKYADQDEEDLEIATRLLGLQRPKASPDTGSSGHNGNEEEKKGDGISSSEKKNKQQHSSSSYSKRRPKEEDDEAVEKQTVGIEELDCLTGKPLREKLSGNKKDDGESKNDDKNGSVGSNVHHDDDDDDKKDEDSPPYRILYAVPVCAPFAAVSDYKFKAKVVPGKMKKGKAVKACIESFTRMPICTVTEKSIMRGMDENKMVAVMISNSKVVLVGPGSGKGGGGGRRHHKGGKKKKKSRR